MVKEIGATPCHVLNVCPCALPEFRAPKAKEIEKLRRPLLEQIHRLKPDHVICLGAVALTAVLGKGQRKISTLSGRQLKSPVQSEVPYSVYALLHPANILRSPRKMASWTAHWKSLKMYWEPPLNHPKTRAVTLEEAKEIVKNPLVLAVDFETTTVRPYQGGKIRSIGLANPTEAVYLPEPHAEALIATLAERTGPTIFHGASFELRWIHSRTGMIPPCPIHDTMVMGHVLDENAPRSLKERAVYELNVQRWDDFKMAYGDKWSVEAPIDVLGTYNALDAHYTLVLSRLYALKLSKSSPLGKLYQNIAAPSVQLGAKMERYGMSVDREWIGKVRYLYQQRLIDLEFKLFSNEVATKLAEEGGWSKGRWNVNSSKQTQKVLYDGLGLSPTKKTKGGNRSVELPILEAINPKPPLLQTYIDYRHLQKITKDFIGSLAANSVANSGVIRADFSPGLAETGRWIVSDPPMHGIPDDPNIRGIINSRFPGGKIISADYSQLELRLIAHLSNEPVLIEQFLKPDGDPHSALAAKLYGPDFTKEQRGIAKNVNFGMAYGAGPDKLVHSFGLTLDQAKALLEQVRQAYPTFVRWKKSVEQEVLKYKRVTSYWGRVRHFPNLADPNDRLTGEDFHALRQAVNFLVQSMGADLTTKAALLLDKQLEGKDAIIIHHIHDAILIDCSPEILEQTVSLVNKIMTEEVLEKPLKVPLAVSVTVADRWGGATEIEKPEGW
jgi:DNA polymerase-1